jgi:hypothetical protein
MAVKFPSGVGSVSVPYSEWQAPAGVMIESTDFAGNVLPDGWSKSAGVTLANEEASASWTANAFTQYVVQPRATTGIDGSSELFVKVRAKKSLDAGGNKFLKIHGQEQDSGTNYANCTFNLIYETGNMDNIIFGDGSGVANDAAAVISFLGDGSANGRNSGIAIVNCPKGRWVWPDTEYHTFKMHVKFNSGTTAESEIPNGEFHVYIDDVLYCSATNLYNRHYSNLPINYLEVMGYAQSNAAFDMSVNLIEVSSGNWIDG